MTIFVNKKYILVYSVAASTARDVSIFEMEDWSLLRDWMFHIELAQVRCCRGNFSKTYIEAANFIKNIDYDMDSLKIETKTGLEFYESLYEMSEATTEDRGTVNVFKKLMDKNRVSLRESYNTCIKYRSPLSSLVWKLDT